MTGFVKRPERLFMEREMRTFLGMVLGCLLTIGAVYIHDMRATSTVATSTTGVETRQIVPSLWRTHAMP